MTLKEYIEILQTFDQNVEVLKRSKPYYRQLLLVKVEKRDVIPPHVHFKYDKKTGRRTLVDSYII